MISEPTTAWCMYASAKGKASRTFKKGYIVQALFGKKQQRQKC